MSEIACQEGYKREMEKQLFNIKKKNGMKGMSGRIPDTIFPAHTFITIVKFHSIWYCIWLDYLNGARW